MSERVTRAFAEGELPPEERARSPLYVDRALFLERLRGFSDPAEAGTRVWPSSEPWLLATAALAQDPSVLLDELPEWARLLDRHSELRVDVSGDDARVRWENDPEVAPDAAECEFRLGALTALLETCSGGEPVQVEHIACRAAGDANCEYQVLEWIPCGDARHASAFQEARLLAARLEGAELMNRRMERFRSERADSIPDLRSLERVRRFMDELEDVIVVLDVNLSVLDANRAALRSSGLSIDEMRGLTARDLLSADSYRALSAALPMLHEVGALRGMQIEARQRKGWATLEVSARVSASGRTIVCIARDVTARLRLERELADRNTQLRDQNVRIADADRLKSEFLANVSHELTTPLTCIKGFARLLLRDSRNSGEGGLLEAQRNDFLEIMQRESDRMTHMIEGLLELSNIESGGVALDRAETSPNEIASECAQLLKPRLDELGLNVSCELDPDLTRARLDRDRFKQVVLNLLENAMKFSPEGSDIRVRTTAGRDVFRLRVRNTTRELEPGDLQRIFARFVQRDGSYTRRQGGVGLGLNLVRAIVELHKGRVWAELPLPDQVDFIIELPLSD